MAQRLKNEEEKAEETSSGIDGGRFEEGIGRQMEKRTAMESLQAPPLWLYVDIVTSDCCPTNKSFPLFPPAFPTKPRKFHVTQKFVF